MKIKVILRHGKRFLTKHLCADALFIKFKPLCLCLFKQLIQIFICFLRKSSARIFFIDLIDGNLLISPRKCL